MEYLTIKDIAKLLDVNEETVRRWIREKKLPAENLGGRTGYRIAKHDFEQFVNSNQSHSTAVFASKSSLLGLGGAMAGIGILNPLAAAIGVAGIAGGYLVKALSALKQGKKELSELQKLKNELLEVQYSLELEQIQAEAKLKQLSHELEKISILLEQIESEIGKKEKG